MSFTSTSMRSSRCDVACSNASIRATVTRISFMHDAIFQPTPHIVAITPNAVPNTVMSMNSPYATTKYTTGTLLFVDCVAGFQGVVVKFGAAPV